MAATLPSVLAAAFVILDRAQHSDDQRSAFTTKQIARRGNGLSDREIAVIAGWSERDVSAIRKRYVDEAAIDVAIGRRIAGSMQNGLQDNAAKRG